MHMIIVVKLLYTQKWKSSILPTIEEWLMTMLKCKELEKLTFLIREKILTIFIANWKPFIDFFHETENKLKLQFLQLRGRKISYR